MDRCKTKYPIFLVHGFGARDDFKDYWGRIPLTLMKNGAVVYLGGTESNATTEYNAEILKRNINKVLDKTGCGKVNIIAHSKGGLDSRYMISSLGMAESVASLVTLSTPHRGSDTMDRIFETVPDFVMRAVSKGADFRYGLKGDKNPETYKALRSFTTSEAEKFNTQNPDSDKVYYESWAFMMKKVNVDWSMAIQYLAVKHCEGINDGLVTPKSAAWTNYKGVYMGKTKNGISHNHAVDLHRIGTAKNDEDIALFYISVAERLKNMGF